MKTFIIIAVTSLAVAGMSFAAPMAKRFGPWKSAPLPKKEYVPVMGGKTQVAPQVKQIPHRHSPFRGSSHSRIQRLHNDR